MRVHKDTDTYIDSTFASWLRTAVELLKVMEVDLITIYERSLLVFIKNLKLKNYNYIMTIYHTQRSLLLVLLSLNLPADLCTGFIE